VACYIIEVEEKEMSEDGGRNMINVDVSWKLGDNWAVETAEVRRRAADRGGHDWGSAAGFGFRDVQVEFTDREASVEFCKDVVTYFRAIGVEEWNVGAAEQLYFESYDAEESEVDPSKESRGVHHP
jgi:hypothetical protein